MDIEDIDALTDGGDAKDTIYEREGRDTILDPIADSAKSIAINAEDADQTLDSQEGLPENLKGMDRAGATEEPMDDPIIHNPIEASRRLHVRKRIIETISNASGTQTIKLIPEDPTATAGDFVIPKSERANDMQVTEA